MHFCISEGITGLPLFALRFVWGLLEDERPQMMKKNGVEKGKKWCEKPQTWVNYRSGWNTCGTMGNEASVWWVLKKKLQGKTKFPAVFVCPKQEIVSRRGKIYFRRNLFKIDSQFDFNSITVHANCQLGIRILTGKCVTFCANWGTKNWITSFVIISPSWKQFLFYL